MTLPVKGEKEKEGQPVPHFIPAKAVMSANMEPAPPPLETGEPMRTVLVLLVIAPLLLTAVPAHAKIYKWVDEKGVTHFSDRKPPAGSGQEAEEYEPDEGSIQILPDPRPAAPGPAAEPESPSLTDRFKGLFGGKDKTGYSPDSKVVIYVTDW
jgi:hypothetical protein